MPDISRLIDDTAPVVADTLGGAILERFLDQPGCDLLVVATPSGQPLGVVSRGAVRPQDAARTAADLMVAPVTIGIDTDLDEACALLLVQRDPPAGLVVIEAGAYRGVVGARALLRSQHEDRLSADAGRRFMEVISQEVRTPMNGVLAVAELLQRQALSSDSQAYVRTIIESSHATLRALSDALELAKANTGSLALNTGPAVLRDVMDQVHTGWEARAAQDGVTLLVAYDGEPDLAAVIDADRVKQVFDGLIDTALTLNRGGTIEASLQASRTPDGLRLIGRVRDAAGGLSAPRLASLFSDSAGSTGDGGLTRLGLALCRRIVERMSGVIRSENNVGAGATIVFEFLAAEVIAEAEAPLRPAGAQRSAHVLVVDDNATNRMVAEALCEMFDYTSECVVDGLEAVEAARTGRFDLILMDIRMPNMDGVEATRVIRQLPGPAGAIPIIALTANADPEDAKLYIAAGMHSVVEKPLKPERLLEAISLALQTQGPGKTRRSAAA
jgi:CheY-like chemotaxis protein/signal transduction histidine kinase